MRIEHHLNLENGSWYWKSGVLCGGNTYVGCVHTCVVIQGISYWVLLCQFRVLVQLQLTHWCLFESLDKVRHMDEVKPDVADELLG